MTNVNVPFSALPTVLSLTGNEIVPLNQAGTTKTTTTSQLAQLNSVLAILQTVTVQAGASYSPPVTVNLIIVQKTVGSPTAINLPLASTKVGMYWVKDGKGDASTNNITVTPSGGETLDGMATVVINIDSGAIQFAPNPLGGWVILNFG